MISPSHDEETKCKKLLIQKIVGSPVNSSVIPGPSPLPPPTTFSEPFMPHPACLVYDAHGIDTMIGVPGCDGSCCNQSLCNLSPCRSCALAIPVDELPPIGLIDV